MTASSFTVSRVLALLLAVVVAGAAGIALWSATGAPLARNAARVDALKSEVAFLKTSKSRLGDVSRWSQVQRDAQAAREDFLSEPTPALAAAALQAAMRSAAQSAGLEIISAQDASYEDGGVKGVSIRMAIKGEFAEFARFLEALERQKPVVLVDEIEMRSTGAGAAGDTLNASVTGVSLFWREGEQ
jgi:hypothetical protein